MACVGKAYSQLERGCYVGYVDASPPVQPWIPWLEPARDESDELLLP
jgi:hypothetical protein